MQQGQSHLDSHFTSHTVERIDYSTSLALAGTGLDYPRRSAHCPAYCPANLSARMACPEHLVRGDLTSDRSRLV